MVGPYSGSALNWPDPPDDESPLCECGQGLDEHPDGGPCLACSCPEFVEAA